MFAHFAVLNIGKNISEIYKIGKKLKIYISFENGYSFMKEYEFRHILSPFWWKLHLK